MKCEAKSTKTRALKAIRNGFWKQAIEEYYRNPDSLADPLAANDFAVALHQSGRSEEAFQLLDKTGDDQELPALPLLNRYYLQKALEVKAGFDIKLEHADHDGLPCPETAPMVSVLVRTYNRPDLLSEALQSLAKQTFRDFETIVVNDGGDPAAKEVAKSFGLRNVRYYYAPHQGNPAALNRALEMAHGKYVTILDDDDIFYPNHLQVHLDYLETEGAAEIACSKIYKMRIADDYEDCRLRWEQYQVRGEKFHLEPRSKANYLIFSVIKRECFNKVGRFFENIMEEDPEMWLRLTNNFSVHQIDEVTGEYRERPKSLQKYRKRVFYTNLVRMMNGWLILASEPANPDISKSYMSMFEKMGDIFSKDKELACLIDLRDLWTMRKPYAWLLEQAEWLKKIDEPDMAMEFIKSAARLAPYQPRVWKRMLRTAKLAKK